MPMKCINTFCQSTRIKVINQANGSVLKNGANLVGENIAPMVPLYRYDGTAQSGVVVPLYKGLCTKT